MSTTFRLIRRHWRAYESGRGAFALGLDQGANPHPWHANDWHAWRRGYLDARAGR